MKILFAYTQFSSFYLKISILFLGRRVIFILDTIFRFIFRNFTPMFELLKKLTEHND